MLFRSPNSDSDQSNLGLPGKKTLKQRVYMCKSEHALHVEKTTEHTGKS